MQIFNISDCENVDYHSACRLIQTWFKIVLGFFFFYCYSLFNVIQVTGLAQLSTLLLWARLTHAGEICKCDTNLFFGQPPADHT